MSDEKPSSIHPLSDTFSVHVGYTDSNGQVGSVAAYITREEVVKSQLTPMDTLLLVAAHAFGQLLELELA
jgi:hypothetical protein